MTSSGEVCSTCPTALRVQWVKWVYTFSVSNDGTVCQWIPPRVKGDAILNELVLLVASRFEPLFSPGTRGNWGLTLLIHFPWAIDATLTPMCL
ncbi:hypothetical protein IGI04_026991 [Brassica rapa subsp. trilocularis]|uniref:Uncharacterized protein n=1 Tax=Brassica rapa subsp. trilocularis TaxID=1813537 RepID=A0ABQ7KXM6_BRACM|nr:hypothetical protein IGI04_026991 [Brassica rapa subsp. trilocularis]